MAAVAARDPTPVPVRVPFDQDTIDHIGAMDIGGFVTHFAFVFVKPLSRDREVDIIPFLQVSSQNRFGLEVDVCAVFVAAYEAETMFLCMSFL